jgi:Mg-chelatase subunit ChlD
LLFVLALPGTAAPLYADGELDVSVREVTSDSTALVRFLAKVVEDGRPISVSSGNFSLRAGDKQVPLTSVQSVTDAQVGVSALLVIDTSGSMVGTPLGAARQAASQYVKSLQPTDEVAVVSFANSSNTISDFSRDLAAVDGSLQGLVAFGDTALYAAVRDASQRMVERPAARRVVILLSDGADFGIGGVNRAEALEAASSSQVPFYVIGLGAAIDTRFLEDLANATGGSYFAAPSSAQLAGLFTEVAELLRREYVLSADFAGSGLSGNTSATVRVELGAKNGEIGITVPLPATTVGAQSRPPGTSRVPAPVQSQPPADGGGSVGPILLLLTLLAAAAVAGWLFWRRRMQRRPVEEYVFSGPPAYSPRETSTPVAREAPRALLRLETGEEFPLSGAATIGVDADCTYQLPVSRSDFGNAELRVWFANQRYVIRDSAPRPRMRVNGRPLSWSFLTDGDEIEVRGLKLRFSTVPTLAAAGES